MSARWTGPGWRWATPGLPRGPSAGRRPPARVEPRRQRMAGSCPVIDEFAKEYLHNDLRWIREALLWKLDGLADYDIRRRLTPTGTNLLGLIKHSATWEA